MNAIPDDQLTKATQIVQAMRNEIAKAVTGQTAVIEQTIIALVAGGHILLEGVPGLGKTLLVRALARTFEGDFGRVQFTPDLMPADVTGHTLFDPSSNQGAGGFTTRKGPIFTHLLLADEINRAPAKTQAALLESMQEGQVTIEGQTHPLPQPFMVLATQNPIEQEGTYPLPEAQLDRFLFKVQIEFPSGAEEIALVRQVTLGKLGDKLDVSAVSPLVKPATISALQQIAAQITVDEQVLDYAVRITRATRVFNGIASGAGPRGGISLVRAARGAALMAGRGFVTPDDIKSVALPVLRHRVVPSPELEIEGQHADGLLTALLNQVPAPRQ